ncbi:MAG TPA: hypothetical protein VJ579_02850 [Candidatus Paceibacterota bacterium]|nr:hypothetical protein [Candidatus Paceibacterota bacterium]
MRARKTIPLSKIPDTIRALLDSEFGMLELSGERTVHRLHDEHGGTGQGELHVHFLPNADMVISITGDEEEVSPSLRFRSYEGGGHSLRTRNALFILLEAIRLDNLDRPDR